MPDSRSAELVHHTGRGSLPPTDKPGTGRIYFDLSVLMEYLFHNKCLIRSCTINFDYAGA